MKVVKVFPSTSPTIFLPRRHLEQPRNSVNSSRKVSLVMAKSRQRFPNNPGQPWWSHVSLPRREIIYEPESTIDSSRLTRLTFFYRGRKIGIWLGYIFVRSRFDFLLSRTRILPTMSCERTHWDRSETSRSSYSTHSIHGMYHRWVVLRGREQISRQPLLLVFCSSLNSWLLVGILSFVLFPRFLFSIKSWKRIKVKLDEKMNLSSHI